ncbi:UDP-forming cellulose synthase catalytic subunit [Vibrio quintilis]|uniref:Cellulose synthase catalytic subunit [UDP-forming] n=1 Tax=Vibrio quintilis TaxID=1117707 RepID=A0A1M7YXU5_9VIBR|nr:UDP-forming cellulose synthase catalytic subunit [Vibrio quintilis]SHO57507.1 Cellulose synthase catalytic subunit [UDP-forming] [Vibrio quintilis]
MDKSGQKHPENRQVQSGRFSDKALKAGIMICFALLAVLAAVPAGPESQLYISLSVIAFVYVMSSTALQHSKLREICRITAIVAGSLLSVRYLTWRGLYTLQTDDLLSLAPMWILFAAEIYSAVVHFFGCFVNIFPLRRPVLSLDNYDDEQIPVIDVMVPSYNEPEELLDITLRAALMMNYPAGKMHVHLLDDGGTDQKINQADTERAREARERRATLQKLCLGLGVQYHTRAENLHAKAGNINSALPACNGDIVVILDADHVPTTDFLSRTVPWMINNDNIFLVQSPHFMANPDPVERNYLDAFTRMPSENDMFYGIVQRGLDFWSASFFCGSAALLRRKSIDIVGGIVGDSITEDAETALELHSRGYESVYVEQPLVSGLAPETFSSFIQQRIRWAQGMAQIMIIKKPFFRPGLSWHQKCGYMSSIVFWLFPFSRLVFLLSPMGYLVFGLELIHASFIDVLAYTIPHVIVTTRISTVLFGRNRWPFISEMYEILQCTFVFRALLTVFRNPHHPSFLVTPKGENLSHDHISSLSGIFYFLLALTIISNIAGIYQYYHAPLSRELTIFVIIWNSFNLLLFLGLLEVLIEKKQLRNYPRLPAYDDVEIEFQDGQTASGCLIDLSVDGVRLRLNQAQPLPETVTLSVFANALNQQIRILCRVRGQSEQSGEIRLQFITQNSEDKNKVVAFALGDSARWESFQRRRTRPISYYYGMKQVLTTSFKPVFKHIWIRLQQRSS